MRLRKEPLYGLGAKSQILMGIFTYGVTLFVFFVTAEISDVLRPLAMGIGISVLALLMFSFYAHLLAMAVALAWRRPGVRVELLLPVLDVRLGLISPGDQTSRCPPGS